MYSKIIILTVMFLTSLFCANPKIKDRGVWVFDDINTSKSGQPSQLKYLKYFDLMPDELSIKVFSKKDLSAFEGKKIFIGYGTVDPRGNNCRIFPSSETGMDNNITVCLPWWRIERTYQRSLVNIKDTQDILCEMATPRPPLRVNVCKKWANSGALTTSGGKVTCTSYYNRLDGGDCWDNPIQPKCFVDNCSLYVKNNCTLKSREMGVSNSLPSEINNGGANTKTDTKLKVVSYQYECPSGSTVPFTHCEEEESVLMFPKECTPDNPSTPEDESEYVYCNEKDAQYDTNGNIVGFLGKCKDGRNIICEVNSLSQTNRVCIDPIIVDDNKTSYKTVSEIRNYKEFTVDVLSGQPDIYSSDKNCVRANTVEAARDRVIQAHIKGKGVLDDDIWVIKHKANGSHSVVYCNQQHNDNKNSKMVYNGVVEQCVSNDGAYSFDKNINIDSSDIVSIQEATEKHDQGATPFSTRSSYRSTAVVIDGKIVAPYTNHDIFPYYPYFYASPELYYPSSVGYYIDQLWENTLPTLSILFPYSGAYQISFFNKDGDKVAEKNIGKDDFEAMKTSGYVQLNLANTMQYYDDFNKTAPSACLDDDWTEWGGGVHGGKHSVTGISCQLPSDGFVKNNAVYKIIIKDLMTGNLIPIPLVYPLAYPNRVFISKLKLYELRKYRCYDDFKEYIPR